MYIIHTEWYRYRISLVRADNLFGHKGMRVAPQLGFRSCFTSRFISSWTISWTEGRSDQMLVCRCMPSTSSPPPPLGSKIGAWRWSLLQGALWRGGTGHKPRSSQSLCHPCARKAPPQLEYRIKSAVQFPGAMSSVLFIAYVARSYHDKISEPHPSKLRDTLGPLVLASHYHLLLSRLHWPWQGQQRFVLLSFSSANLRQRISWAIFFKIALGYSSEVSLVGVTQIIEGQLYK